MGESIRRTRIGFWAFRVAADYRHALEKHSRTLDLGAQDVYVMVTLMRLGPSSLVELARELETPHPSIVRQVDALESRGYAQRSPHPEDRRIKVVSLTAQGMKLMPKVKEWFDAIHQQATAGMSSEEVDQLQRALQTAHHNLCPSHRPSRSSFAEEAVETSQKESND
ncbi:MarR family transcriptional regulator [bacterium]|nr:MarR family transcriptional regulator [bacterium]